MLAALLGGARLRDRKIQRLATAVFLTLAAACIEKPTEPHDARVPTNPSLIGRGELSGWFHTITGDPEGGRGRPVVVHYLVDDKGVMTKLVVEPSLLQHHAVGRGLDGKRVRVRGRIRADRQFEVTEIEPSAAMVAVEQQSATLAGAFPYVLILCKFADTPSNEPRPISTYRTWITSTSAPYLDHYWREQSFDQINNSGSQLVGWFTLPHPRSYYLPNGILDHEALANDCTTAADPSVYFPSFYGIHMQFNQRLDCCSSGGTLHFDNDGQIKQYGVTWMADWADVAVYAHEGGHSLGLPHSSGPYSQVYDSDWDIMSNSSVFWDGNLASWIPQGTISPQKERLGWISASRLATFARNTTRTFTLERLAQPGTGNYLMAKIPIDLAANAPNVFYTVEARRFVGRYDSHVPGEAVVIHRIDPTRREPTVVDVDGNGDPNDAAAMWTPGETFADSANKVFVRVDGMTATGFQVTATYGLVGANRWSAKAPMPTARKQLAAAALGGLLYAIGGSNAAGTVLKTVQTYDPLTNAWTTRPPLPAPRWRTNGAAGISIRVYVAGGVQPGTVPFTKTLYVYNANANQWSVKAPMPLAGGCGGSAAISGILYVLIGCDATTSPTGGAKGILLRYNPNKDTWTTMASAPSGHQFPGVAALQGKLYVVGGKNSSGGVSTALEVYDPATNTWSRKAPLPSARHSLTAAGMFGKIYAVGGINATGNFTNTVYVYDPVANAWSKGSSSMPTGRGGLSGAALAGVLYAVGGNNSGAAALVANESFTPP
jgi:N-acetylneuraminic acid mutarotase